MASNIYFEMNSSTDVLAAVAFVEKMRSIIFHLMSNEHDKSFRSVWALMVKLKTNF